MATKTRTPEEQKMIDWYKTYLWWKPATSENAVAYRKSLNPVVPTTEELKTNISAWTTTWWMSKAQQNYQYNLATWNKQGAREVMLWSEAAKDMKTTVNSEEVKGLSEEGILNPNIVMEKPPITPEVKPVVPEVKTETKIDTPKTDKPTTTTDITYNEDKTAYDPKNVISKSEQYTWSDWKIYQTVRNSDNTLTTIDVTTWQPVTWKYTDAERDSIKQGFLWWTVQEQPKLTANDYFASISQGIEVPTSEKNTIAYKSAYNRKLNLDKYSSMSPADLSYAISQWEFLPWTQTYNDLKAQNPKLVADAEKQNAINSVNQPKSEVTDIQTKITEYLTKMMSDDEKVTYEDRLSQNQDILTLNKNLKTSADRMAELKDQIEYAKEDLQADYWLSWSKGYRNYKIWEKTRELSRQYNLALAEYNTTAWQLKTISDDIKYEMEEQRANEKAKLDKMQTALWMYQTVTADDRALALQQKQLEQQYQYEYWDLNSDNPTLQNIAIERAVADLYTKYPLPWMESQSAKVSKVKERMAQGMTWSEAIASLESEIRNSKRYNQLINPATAPEKPIIQNFWTATSPNYMQYNSSTWNWEKVTWTTWSNLTWLTISQNYWDTSPNSKDNVKLANWKVWTPWVDYSMNENTVINSWIEWEVISAWKKWDYWNQVVIKDSEWNLHMYSHLNEIDVKVWDKITTWTQIALSWNTWFSTWPHLDYRVKWTNWEWLDPNSYNWVLTSVWQTYTDEQISDLAYVTELLEKTPTEWRKALKEMWYTDKDVATYKAWNIPLTDKQKQSSVTLMNSIKELLDDYDYTDATWVHILPKMSWTDRANAERKINTIVAQMTLPNLWVLKWPMSDKDIQFIKEASSNLDITLSDKAFEKELINAYNLWARRAWLPEITKLSDIWKTATSTNQSTWVWNINKPTSDPLGLFN